MMEMVTVAEMDMFGNDQLVVDLVLRGHVCLPLVCTPGGAHSADYEAAGIVL